MTNDLDHRKRVLAHLEGQMDNVITIEAIKRNEYDRGDDMTDPADTLEHIVAYDVYELTKLAARIADHSMETATRRLLERDKIKLGIARANIDYAISAIILGPKLDAAE